MWDHKKVKRSENSRIAEVGVKLIIAVCREWYYYIMLLIDRWEVMDSMRRVTVEAGYVDSLEIAAVLKGMQQAVWYQKRKMPEASAMKHSTHGGKLLENSRCDIARMATNNERWP